MTFLKNLACRWRLHSFKVRMNFEDCGDGLLLPDGRVICEWCGGKSPYDNSRNFEQAQLQVAQLKSMTKEEKLAKLIPKE